MRKSITQRHLYGCAVACLAFVLQTPYTKALKLLKTKQKIYKGSSCRELLSILQENSLAYNYKYLSKKKSWNIGEPLVVVYIKKSKKYPAGHFLVRYRDKWMDPWINFRFGAKEAKAKSGFRKSLPGEPNFAFATFAQTLKF